ITDFGLAKAAETPVLTATGLVMGTPGYMAPEQASGIEVGPAADIHALGAIMYHLLTGRPPFVGPDAIEVMVQVIHTNPISVRRLMPSVPKDLETICLKCLQKPILKRYATAEALAEDLHRYLNGEPILARPIGVAERVWRWVKGHPVVAAQSVAVIALV